MILHAGLIARRVSGLWLGVLIEGPAGSGKSDLAMRAIATGFRLVADDRVSAFTSDGRLYGRAPEALAGLIEVRGVGVIPRCVLPYSRIALRLRCASRPDVIERLPAEEFTHILGVNMPTVTLWALEASAPHKVSATLERLGAAAQQGYQPPFAPQHERTVDQRGRP